MASCATRSAISSMCCPRRWLKALAEGRKPPAPTEGLRKEKRPLSRAPSRICFATCLFLRFRSANMCWEHKCRELTLMPVAERGHLGKSLVLEEFIHREVLALARNSVWQHSVAYCLRMERPAQPGRRIVPRSSLLAKLTVPVMLAA